MCCDCLEFWWRPGFLGGPETALQYVPLGQYVVLTSAAVVSGIPYR